ncbi:MAG: hypothetical protein KC592_19090, partial [Nitrospira sp.]|nr:hypothetical protein [Nitrospira sp.]
GREADHTEFLVLAFQLFDVYWESILGGASKKLSQVGRVFPLPCHDSIGLSDRSIRNGDVLWKDEMMVYPLAMLE